MKKLKPCSECRILEGNRDGGLCPAAKRWLYDENYWRLFTFEEGDNDDSTPSICPLIKLPIRQGKWVCFDGKYYCSECDEEQDYMTYYCSGCGAKMKGVKNEQQK